MDLDVAHAADLAVRELIGLRTLPRVCFHDPMVGVATIPLVRASERWPLSGARSLHLKPLFHDSGSRFGFLAFWKVSVLPIFLIVSVFPIDASTVDYSPL